jgi:hypothetical protein
MTPRPGFGLPQESTVAKLAHAAPRVCVGRATHGGNRCFPKTQTARHGDGRLLLGCASNARMSAADPLGLDPIAQIKARSCSATLVADWTAMGHSRRFPRLVSAQRPTSKRTSGQGSRIASGKVVHQPT